jgi:hypothetical protein
MVAAIAGVLSAAGSARAVEQMDGAAAAVDLKIADDARDGDRRFSGFDYATSDRFHRAWLVLHYQSPVQCQGSDGPCDPDAAVDVKVPGLSYDPAAKQVVYQPEGAEPVVCARARGGGFLKAGGSLAATGNCTYRVVTVDRLFDDGFAGRKDRREEVHFAVRSP